jgi:GNAT superfamily N-acetyltransferase
MPSKRVQLRKFAFSISRLWQRRVIASVFLEKITEVARENGFTGLIEYTHSNNAGMVKLFNRLPDKVETILKGSMLVLKCNFEEAL